MIPQIIHYCWFGRKPKPKLAKKCLRSWKRYCKGYEIIEWNEDTFDITAAPLYVRQAYEAKKWAFVTDYVRLWAMVNYGGIYMDTDVEVVKPLDDILVYEAVSGFESNMFIPTGLMASEKDFTLFRELLREYDELKFIRDDGSYDLTTNVVRITDACSRYGFIPNGELQTVAGFTLFPKDWFCPKEYSTGEIHKTNNTYAIHHFASSWLPDEQRMEHDSQRKENRKHIHQMRRRHMVSVSLKKILGEKNYNQLKKILIRQ